MTEIFLLKRAKRGKKLFHTVTLGRNGEPLQSSETLETYENGLVNLGGMARVFFDMFKQEGLISPDESDENLDSLVARHYKDLT